MKSKVAHPQLKIKRQQNAGKLEARFFPFFFLGLVSILVCVCLCVRVFCFSVFDLIFILRSPKTKSNNKLEARTPALTMPKGGGHK